VKYGNNVAHTVNLFSNSFFLDFVSAMPRISLSSYTLTSTLVNFCAIPWLNMVEISSKIKSLMYSNN
jgi:hypothetical protein